MPRIDIESDSHVFLVQVKNKCTVCVDAFELSGRLMDMEEEDKNDVSVDLIDSVMREIAWAEGEADLDSVNKYEMFAVASKAMKRMDELGND